MAEARNNACSTPFIRRMTSMQLFNAMILVRLSIFVSVNSGSLGCLSSLKFIILRCCFELFEPRLVCHCCFVPKLDMHNIGVYQKESSILYLGYQKASDV